MLVDRPLPSPRPRICPFTLDQYIPIVRPTAFLLLWFKALELLFSFCQNPYSPPANEESDGATNSSPRVVSKLAVFNRGYDIPATAMGFWLLSRGVFVIVLSVPTGATTPGSSESEDSWKSDDPSTAAALLMPIWAGVRYDCFCCIFFAHGFSTGGPV